jgi:hypothetical protein
LLDQLTGTQGHCGAPRLVVIGAGAGQATWETDPAAGDEGAAGIDRDWFRRRVGQFLLPGNE